ncbi:MAG: hypothetical protein WDW38_001723 [Sanguina aurantia]
MLKHLKRVFIYFTPGDSRAVSARELLQRVSSDKARKSNPSCVVDFKINEETAFDRAYVELLFSDAEQRKIFTEDYGVQEISRLIEQKGSEMELRSVMKDVGFDPWKTENRVGLLPSTPTAAAKQQQ